MFTTSSIGGGGRVREARRKAEWMLYQGFSSNGNPCSENLALQPYNNVARGGQNLLCRQNLALQPQNNAVPYGEFGKENAVDGETKEAVEKATYNGVNTYSDLLDVNVRFLEGKITQTPYHFGPVDPETLPLLPDLIRINKAGFHSMGGQPACKERFESRGRYYDLHQKSYIDGIIPKAMAAHLTAFLRNQPVYVDMYQIGPFGALINTFPPKYNLTKDRSSEHEDELDMQEWRMYTNHRPRTESIERAFSEYPRICSLLRRDCLEIMIACKEYGTGSVIDILLEFFNNKPQAPIRTPPAF
jgi:hypothetical protein